LKAASLDSAPFETFASQNDEIIRPLTIDVHCHVLTPSVEELVAQCPEKRTERAILLEHQGSASLAQNDKLFASTYCKRLVDVPMRLADMDAMGVDVQVISPSPTQYYYWADNDLSNQIVTLHNHNIAAIAGAHPKRFIGLGSASLQNAELAAEQLQHAVKQLGLRGVQVSSTVNGVDLAQARLEAFWSMAESLDALVFLHPLGTSLGPRLDEHYLANIIGQPLETAIALSKMIFAGLFDRHDALKVCAAHGGGYLPLYSSRSDHGYTMRPEAHLCARPPSSYLKRIWFDSVVYDSEHLRRLIDAVGISRLVIGTDYPFDMGHYDPHGLIGHVAGLSTADRTRIFSENALTMLGMQPGQFTSTAQHSYRER